jgi:hypothetical protein
MMTIPIDTCQIAQVYTRVDRYRNETDIRAVPSTINILYLPVLLVICPLRIDEAIRPITIGIMR